MRLTKGVLLVVGCCCLWGISCTRRNASEQVVLAKVGSHSITVSEFIRRAEYAIRPPYCRGDGNLDKKIVLNSLLAEKMLALEAGEQNDLATNEHFIRYIQGRKEQVMREELLKNDIYQMVHLGSDKVRSAYRTAGRKYRVQYFSVQNPKEAERIREWLQHGRSFEDIYYQIAGTDSIPVREVEFQSQEPDIIHNALFSDTLSAKQVLGPLKTEDNLFITMRIKGWTERLALSKTEAIQRTKDVTEDLTQREADKSYQAFASRLMQGEKMQLSRDLMEELTRVLAPVYLGSDEQTNQMFLQQLFKKKGDLAPPPTAAVGEFFSGKSSESFLKLNDETWTVADFEQELEKHPLVFRKQKIRKSEFEEQLKYAIADLVRDHFITRYAYSKGFDQAAIVQQTGMMWQDALLALYERDRYLQRCTIGKSDSAMILKKYLNPWIDELQKKYSKQVFVNVREFDRIKLTRIDMFTTQRNVPFPIVVPFFPQVTSDPWLDYGNKMPVQFEK